MQKLPNVAILASGEGSNFEAIVTASQRGVLGGQIVGLLCNREATPVLARAARLKIPSRVVRVGDFPSPVHWNNAMLSQLHAWQAEWVVLAGFTGLIGLEILAKFPSRVVNSHPSLLPKYGGKGMYGARVHRAVIEAGESKSGITIHLLNERFDEGPVLAQKSVAVQPGDTPQTLAERIQAVERNFYPEVLQDLLTGRIKSR